MRDQLSALLDQIAALPRDWHHAGGLPKKALEGIAVHCAGNGPLRHTVETGSGKSTLLFSHLSDHHTVFSLDRGESVAQVRNSPLCRQDAVTFVEGPTQQTLPRFRFEYPLQAVFIDGPHAYPFPDLEYYYLYPHLEEGGVLILDDIHIPTITNMFHVLKADAMFSLIEVRKHTAFFRRTGEPTHDPLGDGWARQGYNAPLAQRMRQKKARKERRRAGLLGMWRRTPRTESE